MRDCVFHSLPSRFQAEALTSGHLDRKTIQNFSSVLRAVIHHGLAQNLFPLYFPAWRPTDSYFSAVDEAFPIHQKGTTANAIRQVRSGLLLLAGVLRDDLRIADILDVEPQDVSDALALLHSPTRCRDFDRVKALCKHVRRIEGNWDHTALTTIVTALEKSRRKPALPYLTHPSVTSVSRSLDALLELLRLQGLPESWAGFLRWYQDFSRLTDEELFDKDMEFPLRFPQRYLSNDSFTARFSVIRAYLGVAIHILGLDPAQLTPEYVFGNMFHSITRRIQILWTAQVGMAVSHASSMGLHHHVYSGGLIAEALYRRSLHARRILPATRKKQPDHQTLDYDAEELAANRTPTERALFTSYREAQGICQIFKKGRIKSSPLKSGNTVKDLITLIHDSPVTNYVKAQDYLLQQARLLVDLPRALTTGERSNVVATLLHGILLSRRASGSANPPCYGSAFTCLKTLGLDNACN